ncbi:hypothetical protein mRhiFer1_009201 [Rhinolophus ferrumequinum]|uniref:Uncharacterized protein n=1 Tax=Rhinolophus ferrumequinum TaxID=59479 RepID=A0A7J7SJP7_RHIFE|nr:hypothetical protein mRhiFer1_009201 [Rhinolophus ferrumequinum]
MWRLGPPSERCPSAQGISVRWREACGSVPLLPNCGSLPRPWWRPYTHRPLLATAGTRKGPNSQTPSSPPLVSSCFKLVLVHFLALNWPKCLVAGLPWERTWDEPNVCKGVLPPHLLLALLPGSADRGW